MNAGDNDNGEANDNDATSGSTIKGTKERRINRRTGAE